MIKCANCFNEFHEEFAICPMCGLELDKIIVEPYQLRPGTILYGRYEIGLRIGKGGFGIVYRAWDRNVGGVVAIKEYYPANMAYRNQTTQDICLTAQKYEKQYEYGKHRFLEEAKNLAKFSSNKNIVKVFDCFEENKTVYFAMQLLEGIPLNYLLYEKGILEVEDAIHIVEGVAYALNDLHKHKIIHRDVSPDNIYVDENGKITLFDFGTAVFAGEENEMLDVVLKPGFAPPEQYERVNKQGPWTDVYALGVTLYVMLTMIKPDESTVRKAGDAVLAPHISNPKIPQKISDAIMRAMALDKNLRFSSAEDFLKALRGEKKIRNVDKERNFRKMRRLVSLAAIMTILLISGLSIYGMWDNKKSEALQKEATISIWLTGKEGDSKHNAFIELAEIFTTSFPAITIDIISQEEDTYVEKILEAIKAKKMPHLFESTWIAENDLENAKSVKSIVENSDLGKCPMIQKCYENSYDEYKKIPLGFAVPAVYIVDNKIEKDIVSSLEELNSESYSKDDEFARCIPSTFGLTTSEWGKKQEFFQETVKVLVSSTNDYFDVRRDFAGRYQVLAIKDTEVKGLFGDEWSVGSGSKDEIRATNKFLAFMLSAAAQDILYLQQEEKSGLLPVNQETFNEYTTKIFSELSAFEELFDRYKIVGSMND